eukprot:Seg806.14 transcript_id=Seg806.14/GoldUCD/mRNA.D3Y31 product="hypothetical protein" protein_id=Seg806.14/GoldUCD/D3Y31
MNEILLNDKEHKCDHCAKRFKTVAGLRRHTTAKHTKQNKQNDDALPGSNDDEIINAKSIEILLFKTCTDISTNKCYGEEINSAFASYYKDEVLKRDGFVTNAFFANIQNLSSKLINSSNKEAFYSDYYGDIIFDCQSYFPTLDSTHGSLLTTELCEKIINEVQFLTSPGMVTQQPTVSLTERDINCIEYIGGYVLRKVFYSMKMKQKANGTILSILSCFKSDEFDEDSLLSVLNCGGLWTINENAKNLFI